MLASAVLVVLKPLSAACLETARKAKQIQIDLVYLDVLRSIFNGPKYESETDSSRVIESTDCIEDPKIQMGHSNGTDIITWPFASLSLLEALPMPQLSLSDDWKLGSSSLLCSCFSCRSLPPHKGRRKERENETDTKNGRKEFCKRGYNCRPK